MPRISTRNRFATLAATALGASLLAVATAPAAIAAVAEDATVNIGGLDLSSESGRVTMTARIERAARTVCKQPQAKADLRAEKTCVATAKAKVMRHLAERVPETNLGG